MPYFRIILWLTERNTVKVLRGIRFFDADIDAVRYLSWNRAEEAFPDCEVKRVEVQELPNDSRSLKEYLREEERQRLERKVKDKLKRKRPE